MEGFVLVNIMELNVMSDINFTKYQLSIIKTILIQRKTKLEIKFNEYYKLEISSLAYDNIVRDIDRLNNLIEKMKDIRWCYINE